MKVKKFRVAFEPVPEASIIVNAYTEAEAILNARTQWRQIHYAKTTDCEEVE